MHKTIFLLGMAGLLRTQFSFTTFMAYVTRILFAVASQISSGRTMESRMSRSYSEAVTNHVRTNVSRIKNKYVSYINNLIDFFKETTLINNSLDIIFQFTCYYK